MVQQHMHQLIERINALELRQRIMLLAAGLIVIFFVADSLAIQPALKQQKVLKQAIADWELKLEVLRQRTGILPDYPSGDGNPVYDGMLSQLDSLNAQIHEQMGGLLAPEQAISVLEQVLEQEEGLALLSVYATRQPLSGNELSADGELASNAINRYQMELQLKGSYLATLRYLRALESLPWKFFWESLEYEVIEHPQAQITIGLYTLGIPGDV